jgi:hypothetical protein
MAEYVESMLATGETLVTNARQHWVALIRFALQPILILVLAFIGLGIGFWLDGNSGFISQILDTLVGLATLAGFVVAAVWLPVQIVRWTQRRFVLTSRRVIRADGWLRKASVDAGLDKITDVGYRQTWLGSKMGFGDLTVATAANQPLQMRELIGANEFKKAIMDQQEALVRTRAASLMGAGAATTAAGLVTAAPAAAAAVAPASAAPAAAPASPPAADTAPAVASAPDTPASNAEEITATLATLRDMVDAGTITEADYEAKKAELLERL